MASRFGATGIPSNGVTSGAVSSARTQRNGRAVLSPGAEPSRWGAVQAIDSGETNARRDSETLRQETLTRLGIQAVEACSVSDPVPFCMRRIGRRGAAGKPGHTSAEPEGASGLRAPRRSAEKGGEIRQARRFRERTSRSCGSERWRPLCGRTGNHACPCEGRGRPPRSGTRRQGTAEEKGEEP